MLWRMTLPGCHAAAAWSLLSGCWLGNEAHPQPMEALRAAECSSARERTPPVRLLTVAVVSASARCTWTWHLSEDPAHVACCTCRLRRWHCLL